MAGAGFKTFVDGDILTAAEVNTYLMEQAVMRFADSAARTSAIAAPSEGMVTYLVDTDRIEYYDGVAWQPILDQDVIEAKGDLIVGTADDAVSRLAVGSNGYVLTADSGEATGMKWASVSGGGMVELATGSLTSGSSISLTSISSAYKNLELWLYGVECNSDFTFNLCRFNNDTGTSYRIMRNFGSSQTGVANLSTCVDGNTINSTGGAFLRIRINGYATTSYKIINTWQIGTHPTVANDLVVENTAMALWYSSVAINRIDVGVSQTFTAGTYKLWGFS